MYITWCWAFPRSYSYIIQSYIPLPAVANNSFKQDLIRDTALYSTLTIPPDIGLGTRPGPDHGLVPALLLQVHIESVDMGTKHVVPE